MAEPIAIAFDEINQGDTIRVIRQNASSTVTLEGTATHQDEDGDWCAEDDLLTYRSGYEEKYFLLQQELPTEPGAVISFPSALNAGCPVFALKTHGDEGWLTTFPDGSSALIADKFIAQKTWRRIR